MEKYIEKTLNILRDLYQKMDDDITYEITIKSSREMVQAIISRYITGAIGAWLMYENEAIDSKLIFDEPALIAPYAEDKSLTTREFSKLVFYIIERNILSGLLTGKKYSDIFEKSSLFELRDRILEDKDSINDIVTNKSVFDIHCAVFKGTTMVPQNEGVLNRITLSNNPNYSIAELQHFHLLIKEHYLDKKDSYEESDIAIVIKALYDLSFSENICREIGNYLLFELEKRNNKKAEKKQYIPAYEPLPRKTNTLSKKEYNLLYRELLTYFDFNNMQPIKYLNLDEIIYCLHILIKLKMRDNVINSFLRIINKYNRSQNPLALYTSLYNKLNTYQNNPEFKNKMTDIASYIKEMYISSDEEYIEWKELLSEELASILELCSEDYTYELNEAQKLSLK